MDLSRTIAIVLTIGAAFVPARAHAQPAAPPPPPLWETQIGASFVGTSGNSQTSTVGGDFRMRRRWPAWQVESDASVVRTTDRGAKTGERYLATLRGQRRLNNLLSFSGGERAERDRFAGIDFRNLADAGLGWALVRSDWWTLDGLTSLAWLHESRVLASDRNNPNAIYQALSRIVFAEGADATQRVAFFQDFRDTSAYRSEVELTAQAAMNARLALKFGYLVRYANEPVAGFDTTDNTATASIVLRWRSLETAPNP
jgi:putative salt-induced outer membrane protein YdiY